MSNVCQTRTFHGRFAIASYLMVSTSPLLDMMDPVKMIYCLWTSFIPSVSFLHRPSDTADSFTQVSAQMSLYQEDDHQWLTTNPTIYTPSSDGHLLDFCLIGWASLLHFVATPLLYSCLMYLRPPFLLLCAMPDYQNLTSKSGIYSN